MSFFPPLGLVNRYYLGDTVLVLGVAEALAATTDTDVYVLSGYPELFAHHPGVQGLGYDKDTWPEDIRFISMDDGLSPTETVDGKRLIIKNRMERLYSAAGLSISHLSKPTLYLGADEQAEIAGISRLLPRPRIGVVLGSRHEVKNWPYMRVFLSRLRKAGWAIFLISEFIPQKERQYRNYGVHYLCGLSLRDLMKHISVLDVVVGVDTGPMHLAAALGVPTVVLIREVFSDIYSAYTDCKVVSTTREGKSAMWSIAPGRVFSAVAESLPVEQKSDKQVANTSQTQLHSIKKKNKLVGLFRLDGLGGTVTLSDHAKKIYEQTGLKSVALVRGNAAVFADNPYIKHVVSFGYRKWGACLNESLASLDTIAEIRFALGKWHQNNGIRFEQDFESLQGLFDKFPLDYRDLESEGLHHVSLANKTLGLPCEEIETKIYTDKVFPGLPSNFVLISNGVDAQHRGMQQTKLWRGWDKLVANIDFPCVQVGTQFDEKVPGAIDLRGKTKLDELFYVLKQADAILCCEGGVMHLAYALDCPKVAVIRGPTRGKLFEYPGHKFIDSYVCDNCWSTTADWYERCPKGLDCVCMNTITPTRVEYAIKGLLYEDMVESTRV